MKYENEIYENDHFKMFYTWGTSYLRKASLVEIKVM